MILAVSDEQLRRDKMSYELRAPGMTVQKYIDEYVTGRDPNSVSAGHTRKNYNDKTRDTVEEIKLMGAELGVPTRRIGTYRATGKAAEPKDTLAQIHAGERVLNPNEAASVNGLPQAMSQLNTLTAQIRDLMVQQNNLTSQVNRGVRGMSNDYLKGAMV